MFAFWSVFLVKGEKGTIFTHKRKIQVYSGKKKSPLSNQQNPKSTLKAIPCMGLIYIYNYLLYSQGSFFHLLVGPVDFVPAGSESRSFMDGANREGMECWDVPGPGSERINGDRIMAT